MPPNFRGTAHDKELKRLSQRTVGINARPIEGANGGKGVSGAAKKRAGVTTLKPFGRASGGATGSSKRPTRSGKQFPGS